jgi:hypothetical protein
VGRQLRVTRSALFRRRSPRAYRGVGPVSEDKRALAASDHQSEASLGSGSVMLRGPLELVFVAEPGQLDERARLAFGGGQCHGLALALKRRFGWALIAVDDASGKRIHVCVRRPDGILVDVAGAHDPDDFEAASPGCTLHEIEDGAVADLVVHEDWADPDVDGADGWVDAVITQASNPSASGTPLRTPTFVRTVDYGSFQVRFVWTGDPGFDVSVRHASPSTSRWVPCSRVQFPRDARTSVYIIDFTREVFFGLTQAWLQRQFDPAKAKAKLSGA